MIEARRNGAEASTQESAMTKLLLLLTKRLDNSGGPVQGLCAGLDGSCVHDAYARCRTYESLGINWNARVKSIGGNTIKQSTVDEIMNSGLIAVIIDHFYAGRISALGSVPNAPIEIACAIETRLRRHQRIVFDDNASFN